MKNSYNKYALFQIYLVSSFKKLVLLYPFCASLAKEFLDTFADGTEFPVTLKRVPEKKSFGVTREKQGQEQKAQAEEQTLVTEDV
jgi:hypothetical protein